MEKNNCFKCKDREVGCHGSCKAYLDTKKKLEEVKEKKRKHADFIDYVSTNDFARKRNTNFRR